MAMSTYADSLKKNLLRKYGNRYRRYLQLVAEHIPYSDSERRAKVTRTLRKKIDRDFMTEYMQNMLVIENLSARKVQGSMMDPDVWQRISEDKSN